MVLISILDEVDCFHVINCKSNKVFLFKGSYKTNEQTLHTVKTLLQDLSGHGVSYKPFN